tara:strand:- start:2689 stop:3228 length:540 start_codon:yes stop_codon:yes gene_type:complete
MSKVWDYKSNENDKLSNLVEKKGKDIVMTNPEMAKMLLSRINFKEGDILMECCKGSGAFYNNFPEFTKNEWCEITEGKDFLDYNGKVDYTISNPPFVPRKLFWDIHLKAMDITKKEIYWLMNVSCMNIFTPNRIKLMNDKGWFFQQFHIVHDKRWFGRYMFVKFSRENKGILTTDQTNY